VKNIGATRIAADSFEEIRDWTRFLLSPLKEHNMVANGFLWIGTYNQPLLLAIVFQAANHTLNFLH